MKAIALSVTLALSILISSPAQAVINGQFLRGPDFHWVVRVVSDKGLCTGSLLDSGWVLTAGHCVAGKMSVQVIDYPPGFDFEKFQDMDEVLAEYSGPIFPERRSEFILLEEPVEKVFRRMGMDLALLKVKNPIASVTRFAKIATQEEVQSLASRNYLDLVVAGFGINGKLGRPTSEVLTTMFKYYYQTALDLKAVRITFPIPPANVYQTYRGFRPPLTDTDPGTGQPAIGSPGDSGGPLLAEVNGEWKIIGINLNAMGDWRWMKFVFGGDLEMPGRFWHLKIDQRQLCQFSYLSNADLNIPWLRCESTKS